MQHFGLPNEPYSVVTFCEVPPPSPTELRFAFASRDWRKVLRGLAEVNKLTTASQASR